MRGCIHAFVKYIILSVIGAILYIMAAKYAFIERGYFAVGGEAFMLLLPVFYCLVSSLIRDVMTEYRKSRSTAVSDRSPKK